MTTVLLYLLLVCIGLIFLAAWLVHGAWPMALGLLGPAAPAVIGLALVGAALMVMSQRTRMTLPLARVVRQRNVKGARV